MKHPELAGNSGCFPERAVCPRGHVKDEVGRTSNGTCRQCQAQTQRERQHAKQVTTNRHEYRHAPLLPVAPLVELLAREGIAIAWFDSNTARAISRAKAKGFITVFLADEVLCSIGIHPASVYGDAFYTAERPTKEAS